LDDDTKHSAYLGERQSFTELTAFSAVEKLTCQPQFVSSNHHSSKQ